MCVDANTAYLNRYLEKQEEQERDYEEMLVMLRDSDPEEYEEIIESFGYTDYDLADIIGDL